MRMLAAGDSDSVSGTSASRSGHGLAIIYT